MLIEVCTSKIHRAVVTDADLDYVGSVTIDRDLVEAAGLREFQMVNVNNLANGTLWQTYVMAGERGRGDICLNGPPARHFRRGDLVIILGKALVTPEEADRLEPVVVFVDEKNRIDRVVRHSPEGGR